MQVARTSYEQDVYSKKLHQFEKIFEIRQKKALPHAIAMQIEVKSIFSTCISVFWLIFRSYQPLFLENENHKQNHNHSLEWLF